MFEIFWHPKGDKSKIKSFDPLESQEGLSEIDSQLLNNFRGSASVAAGNLIVRENSGLVSNLKYLIDNGRLYTRRSVSQKQFKKVKSFTKGEVYCDLTQSDDGNYFGRLAVREDFDRVLLSSSVLSSSAGSSFFFA